MQLLAALAARFLFAKRFWSRPLQYGALLVLVALLQACAVNPQQELLGGGALFLEDAVQAYVRVQVRGSLNITLLTSQLWHDGRGILFRYETIDPRGQQLQHLGLAFAEPAGLVGWRVGRIVTVVRRPAAPTQPIERYVGHGLLPGSMRSYTRVAGHVNLAGARARADQLYRRRGRSAIFGGWKIFLPPEGPARVMALLAFDANGQPIGKPSR